MPAMTRPHRTVLALALAIGIPMALLAAASSTAFATPHSLGLAHAERTRYHFDNIPVRSALQLLAEEGGFNLVVPDSVTGTISLHLDDVTWEQALAVVLRLKGLDLRVLGNSRVVDVR